MQSTTSHPVTLRSILILSSQLYLDLSSGLLLSGVPTKILQAFLFSAICETLDENIHTHYCYSVPVSIDAPTYRQTH